MLKCCRCGKETPGRELSPGAISAICMECSTQSDDGIKRLVPHAKGKYVSKKQAAHAASRKAVK